MARHHSSLERAQKQHLKEKVFTGVERVQATARVCAMNLLLHGIGSEKTVPVRVAAALAADPRERFDVVLANPPFGKSRKAGTQKPWIDDLRTNQHFTPKTNPLRRADLDEFVCLYQAANRHVRATTPLGRSWTISKQRRNRSG